MKIKLQGTLISLDQSYNPSTMTIDIPLEDLVESIEEAGYKVTLNKKKKESS